MIEGASIVLACDNCCNAPRGEYSTGIINNEFLIFNCEWGVCWSSEVGLLTKARLLGVGIRVWGEKGGN